MKEFELNNNDNYKKDLNDSLIFVLIKYSQLINEFLYFCNDNLKIPNIKYNNYIILKGFSIITFVFNLLLLYSKNTEFTYHHCQKSFYYFIEFIGQISQDNSTFLQLNSKDAMLFVYKKTLFDIDNDSRNKHREESSLNYKSEFIIIDLMCKLYEKILVIILNNTENNDKDIYTKMNVIMEKQINFIKHLNNSEIKIYLTNLNVILSSKIKLCENYELFKKLNSFIIKHKYLINKKINVHKEICQIEKCNDHKELQKIIKTY